MKNIYMLLIREDNAPEFFQIPGQPIVPMPGSGAIVTAMTWRSAPILRSNKKRIMHLTLNMYISN